MSFTGRASLPLGSTSVKSAQRRCGSGEWAPGPRPPAPAPGPPPGRQAQLSLTQCPREVIVKHEKELRWIPPRPKDTELGARLGTGAAPRPEPWLLVGGLRVNSQAPPLPRLRCAACQGHRSECAGEPRPHSPPAGSWDPEGADGAGMPPSHGSLCSSSVVFLPLFCPRGQGSLGFRLTARVP